VRSVSWIQADAPPDAFPDPVLALDEPNGLLAVGGDLRAERLLAAYRQGIFPWYGDGQPILWWSPDPRLVLFPGALRRSRSLRKRLRQGRYRVSANRAFEDVVRGCAAPRPRQAGTWITDEMAAAYVELHAAGHAHSLECWDGDRLVGGLYGVAIGAVFFGESMFSRASDASKVALATLCECGYALVDCQLPNPHLARLGAAPVPRERFLALLARACRAPTVVPRAQPAAAQAPTRAASPDPGPGVASPP